jgi:hypothetical protein
MTTIKAYRDLRAQPGEQVQQIADALIEDSPYQARQPFSDESVEDLAQGMRAAGFQGVLIVRPRRTIVAARRQRFRVRSRHPSLVQVEGELFSLDNP